MLKEYLLRQGSGTGRWGHGMPGVQICRFSLPEPEQEPLRSVPVCGAPLQFEALFCMTGRLTVRALQGASCMVEAPGIFLLSDSSALRSCQCSGNLGGVLIAVDAKAAKESLVTVCSTRRRGTVAWLCAAHLGRSHFLKRFAICLSRSRNATVFSSRWNCCICSAPRYLNRMALSPAQAAQYPTVCWKSRHTSRRICLISLPLRSSANTRPVQKNVGNRNSASVLTATNTHLFCYNNQTFQSIQKE